MSNTEVRILVNSSALSLKDEIGARHYRIRRMSSSKSLIHIKYSMYSKTFNFKSGKYIIHYLTHLKIKHICIVVKQILQNQKSILIKQFSTSFFP